VCPHSFYIVNKAEIISHFIGLDVTLKARLHRDEVREEFKKPITFNSFRICRSMV